MTLPFKGGHNPVSNEIDVIFILLFLKKNYPSKDKRAVISGLPKIACVQFQRKLIVGFFNPCNLYKES